MPAIGRSAQLWQMPAMVAPGPSSAGVGQLSASLDDQATVRPAPTASAILARPGDRALRCLRLMVPGAQSTAAIARFQRCPVERATCVDGVERTAHAM